MKITWNKTSNWYDDSRGAEGLADNGRKVTVWQYRGLVVPQGGGTPTASPSSSRVSATS